MMPWWHLTASLIISYVLVASLGLEFYHGLELIIVGCVAGTLIDLDHLLYAFLTFRERAWEYIEKGLFDPKGLMEEFRKGGRLYFHAWRRMILHCITMLSIYAISLNFFPSYSLVIGITFIVHLIMDIEPRWLFA